MNIETIRERNKIINIIRDFFTHREYLEVETPLLSPYLIPESNIETFETTHIHPFKGKKSSYLVPSPEVWLKRFISIHKCNIFEISKCFRNSEQSGKHHNPEFSMIEYYTMDADHNNSLNLTIELLDYINKNYPLSRLPREHQILTMEDAFIQYAGFSLKDNYTIEKLQLQMDRLKIEYDKADNWEVSFNRIFLDKVEPQLTKDKNLFLTDFPSKIKTLAKDITGTPWAQRWELYIGGIECGNCYNEECNKEAVEEYFKAETKEKETNLTQHNVDISYPSIFSNFPNCSGGAIGIDRLIMGILGIDNIQGVILFPYHDII